MNWVLIIIAVIFLAVLLMYFAGWFSPAPIISLVYFFEKSRDLSVDELHDIVSETFNISLVTGNKEARAFVAQVGPEDGYFYTDKLTQFLIQMDDKRLLVNVSDKSYTDDVEEWANSIMELRLRRAVLAHEAWLSVDALPGFYEDNKDEAYRDIAKIMSQLPGDEKPVMFCPELERGILVSDEMLEEMKSDDPLSVFDSEPIAPILEVDGDHPKMQAAVEEARDRWGEFVDAFNNNKNNQESTFWIKAEFVEGEYVEYMWVSVNSLDVDAIKGRLENHPNVIQKIKEGDQVTVELSALNDWVYTVGEKSEGCFTQRAMQEIYDSE
jgi:uncharacterized protein YegJ (DUF2314 family)